MKAKLLERVNEHDQQTKIMQEIQEINKKLSVHGHAAKPPHPQNSLLKPQVDPQQKYFSEQCDDLFADHNFLKKPNTQNPIDESLFNSNSTLLLGNQFQKEVRNFPQFSTNHFSSQKQLKFGNVLKAGSLNEAKVQSGYNSKSIEGKCSELENKNQKNFSSNKLISKSSSQASLSMKKLPTSNKNTIAQKQNQMQKSLNKLIENKENIQPNLNIPKQSFIKEIKKKIRFVTQPDEYICQSNQFLESFENANGRSGKHLGSLIQRSSKSRTTHQKPTLECTFKPSILKKSHDIAQNLQPSFERLTQDITISKSQSKLPYKAKQELTDKKYSVKRLELMSQPRKPKQPEKESPNYDFKPTLSKKSLSQMANCTMDVASRNKLWLEQKEAKLCRLKEQEEQKKIKKEGGPFAPKITPYKGQSQVHLSRFTKQGISSYFERVSMAKQKTQVTEKKKPAQKEEVKDVNTYMKKKTYDEAVKELHKKILTMNI